MVKLLCKVLGLSLLIANGICLNYGLNNDGNMWMLVLNLLGILASAYIYVVSGEIDK